MATNLAQYGQNNQFLDAGIAGAARQYAADQQAKAVLNAERNRKLLEQQNIQANKPRGNFLTSMLPTAGGAVGAVLGTVLAPVAGTAAGGAAGAGLGEYLRQKITGESKDGIDKGNIVQEGVLGALPGIFKGAKALKAAGNVSVREIPAVLRGGEKLAEGAGAITKAASAASGEVEQVGKLAKIGSSLRAEASGIKGAAKGAGNKALTVNRAKEVESYVDTLGAAKNSAAKKLAAVEADMANSGKRITSALESGNRALTSKDFTDINTAISKVKPLGGVGDSAKIADLQTRLKSAKSLTDLHEIKKLADDELLNAFKKEGRDALTTGEEKVLRAYRTEINKVIGSSVKDYSVANKNYSLALDAQKVLQKNANPSGLTLFGIKTGLGGESVQAGKDTVGRVLQKAGNLTSGITGDAVGGAAKSTSSFRPFLKAGLQQGVARVAASPFTAQAPTADTTDTSMGANPYDLSTDTTSTIDAMGGANAQPVDQMQGMEEKFQQAMLDDINQTGGKNVERISNIYKSLKALSPETAKPKELNSTAAATVTDLQNGIANLESLKTDFANSNTNTGTPFVGKVRALNPFDTGAKSMQANISRVKQVIGKALEGGVLRKEDEAKYEKILPTLSDSDAVANNKIDAIAADLKRKLALYQENLGVGNGGVDINSVLSGL